MILSYDEVAILKWENMLLQSTEKLSYTWNHGWYENEDI